VAAGSLASFSTNEVDDVVGEALGADLGHVPPKGPHALVELEEALLVESG